MTALIIGPLAERYRHADGVCIAHCCLVHGCKYGYEDCVVSQGQKSQDHPCEECHFTGIQTAEEVKLYDLGKMKICPHCRHVLDAPVHNYPWD